MFRNKLMILKISLPCAIIKATFYENGYDDIGEMTREVMMQ